MSTKKEGKWCPKQNWKNWVNDDQRVDCKEEKSPLCMRVQSLSPSLDHTLSNHSRRCCSELTTRAKACPGERYSSIWRQGEKLKMKDNSRDAPFKEDCQNNRKSNPDEEEQEGKMGHKCQTDHKAASNEGQGSGVTGTIWGDLELA